ncbi:MAG: tRNA (cytidine(34)-2'-O)-methyltransferase [Gammaproteobacteria bacterium]|nr:tRNA (cytidine(34)-2'-O)-methyltransferase [Gammaproteobacteria bacterium]
MFEVVLHESEIPPNTGNVIRLCANTGCRLHLIEPLGFTLEDARLRRAGLDYHEYAGVLVHRDLSACLTSLDTQETPDRTLDTQEVMGLHLGVQSRRRVYAFSTRGARRHDQIRWRAGDVLLFGAETRGLPEAILAGIPEARRVRLPMRPHNRSLNLSNAVAVAVFEAWRQLEFSGGS